MGTQLPTQYMGPGSVVQSVVSEYTTYTSASTTKTYDDNLPTSSDGTQITTVTITPKSATNILRISAQVCGAISAASGMTAWVLRDSAASAIGASYVTPAGADYGLVAVLAVEDVAGSTAATTFKLRVGTTGGTWYVNGTGAGRRHGGAMHTFIRVEEIAA